MLWWLAVAGAAASIVLGVVFLARPGALATIIYPTGIWLLVMGALQLFLVLRTRPAAV